MNMEALDSAFLKTLTVLVVEDDPCAREEMAFFLRRRVGTLVTAEDGLQGLEAFRQHQPAIVVTDIQMPHLDGLSMIEAIRLEWPSTPVIVSTAFDLTSYLLRAIELGVDRFVLKPIQAEPLERALTVCAHRLLAEAELALKAQREREALEARHDAARAVLMAGLAHDYNNLLQAILVSVDLAKLVSDPQGASIQFLEMAKRSSEEARLLARRLATLGGASHRLDACEALDPVVQAEVRGAMAGSPVLLTFDLQGGEGQVRHQAEGLAQVLRNLAENARDAMPNGGTLRVATEARGAEYRIRFQDTGPGITPENLGKVFDPYFSTKPRGSVRGMGLGLALCEVLAKAHRGTLSVASEPGHGATFTLCLPLVEPA